MHFYVDPMNLNSALVGIAALVSAWYFVRVKQKSTATWFLLGFLAAWAFNTISVSLFSFADPAIRVGATFYLSPFGLITVAVSGLAGVMLAQAAYRFQGTPYPREANVVLLVSIASVVAFIWSNLDSPPLAVGGTRWLSGFWALWGVVVIARKRLGAFAAGLSLRAQRGIVAVGGFILIVVLTELFQGINFIQGSSQTVWQFVLGQILQFTAVLAFPVVYVQYAPEPTTFQVKLVGFVLLVVLSVFGILGAHESVMDGRRIAFDPAPEPQTITFLPDGDGFNVTRQALKHETEFGRDLRLADDEKVVIDLPFAFPFAGDSLRRVVVSANGAIEPTDDPYSFPAFSFEISTARERALIAPWFTDLNPGAAGSVNARVDDDALVVTWSDVPEWNYFEPYTIQAILYASGQIDFNYVELPFDTYVGATGILSKPPASVELLTARSAEQIANFTPGLDQYLTSAAVANPFSLFDRRWEFKSFLHGETLPYLRVVLGTLAFILLVAPFFFGLSLTRPLDRLMGAVRRVNSGDLDVEIPVVVHDEFGHLSENFNQMTRSLRTYASEMESLVAARTSELNASLETLKSTQEQLVQQEKLASLGQLTAGIAHEIKNPLNFINNFAELNVELADELAEASAAGEDVSELIADLRQNAALVAEHGKRADGIVRSMMEHARHSGGEHEATDVNQFVEEYVNLAYHGRKAAVPDLNVELIRNYGTDVGTAPLIRQDLGRVLVNLVSNALDAVADDVSEAAPVVTVSTRRDVRTDTVVIEVVDSGPGVPPELRQQIFEPFFTTKPTGKGTGLGLSLSYDIVTSGHGGTLELVASGGGAHFAIHLPASAS